MRPDPGQVLHFSEDPTITRFVPHVAPTSRQPDAYVWAVDYDRAPDYWFPRECPRGMAWVTPETSAADREHILGPGGGDRVHAIEYRWLERMLSVKLFAYRLPAEHFQPFGSPVPNASVSTVPVDPLGPPEPVGDLLRLHEDAGIQLRIMANLWSSGTASSRALSVSAVSGFATRWRAPKPPRWPCASRTRTGQPSQ